MKIDFKVKRFFFDRAVVLDHFGKSGRHTLQSLARVGAFMRTRARSLLRRRKRISNSGQSPSVHTQDATITLKNVQFAYDFGTSSVVVGSVLTNGGRKGSVPVPQLLEAGGTTTRQGKSYHYNPHPWMRPALDAELAAGSIPECWAVNLNT